MTRFTRSPITAAFALLMGGVAAAICFHDVTARATALPFYGTRDFTPHASPVGHRVGSFSLLDQTRRPLRSTDLAGKIHVASFLFASCPSVCPTLVQRLKTVQEQAEAWPDVLLVSFSVTPAIDTPEVLAEFGQARGIRPDKWKLLTGDVTQITRLFRESYFADDDRARDAAGSSPKLLHSEKVLLVDGDGRLRGVYDGTLAVEMEHLIEDIQVLRAER